MYLSFDLVRQESRRLAIPSQYCGTVLTCMWARMVCTMWTGIFNLSPFILHHLRLPGLPSALDYASNQCKEQPLGCMLLDMVMLVSGRSS